MTSEMYHYLSLFFFCIAVITIIVFMLCNKDSNQVEKPESTQLLEDFRQLLKEYRELNNAPTYDKEKHEELRSRLEILRKQMDNL